MTTETQLYRHFDKSGALLYVGISLCTVQRLGQHENGSHWFDKIAHITIETFPTREAAEKAEKKAIKAENPQYNLAHVSKSAETDPTIGLVWGAAAIGQYLGRSKEATWFMLEKGRVPGARKVAGRWGMHVPTFLAAFTEPTK